ncbi:hypothetical protein V6N13_044149 [Hibiscus sabdariffa]|uniref:F-box domain-containing protein n=1 Tax=Hibiscus sabdariffa TaxID=183260 RepID=A0ABR2RHX6_9ROSI
MEGRISWSGLPVDLWTKIGQCLDARFDIIRFRSVCKTWRNSLPISHPRNWYLPMKPFNFNDDDPLDVAGDTRRHFFIVDDNSSNEELSSSIIIRSTVYILRQYPTPNPIPTPWLFKLEESEQGKLRVVNPISDAPVKDLPSNFPKVLNLLDYPILEVNRGCIHKEIVKRMFRQEGEEPVKSVTNLSVSKAVILPGSDLISKQAEVTVLFLCLSGRLLLWRNADERLMKINEAGFYYDDIAVYRGRFVAVDRWGIVSFVDSSFRLVQYTPPVLNGGHKKHLVVSSEHLYVVDRYFDRPQTATTLHHFCNLDSKKVVDFKLFKLDEDYGWLAVTSLDDRILFIGRQSNFFVPIKELSGCKGNCIYFIDEKRWYNDEDDALIGSTGHGIAVFDLVVQRVRKLSSFPGYSDMLWPPPSWFTAK